MSNDFVKNPSDVVAIGDKVKVRVIEIDEQGRINLSMKFGPDADKPRGGSDQGGGFGYRGPRQDIRGEDRPYRPHSRPSFAPPVSSGSMPPIRGPRHDDPPGAGKHPLARQFERERVAEFRKNNPIRRGAPRPFKKTHY